MEIYLTTAGRASRQKTLANLPPAWRERTTLVVQEKEEWMYKPVHPRLLVLPATVTRLSETRQFLLDIVPLEHVCLLDDDLQFYRRKSVDDWHLAQEPRMDIADEMLKHLERTLKEGYAHCGVSPREGNNRIEKLALTATRMMRVLAYNFQVMRDLKVRFDRLPVMSDFDMTLQLLRLGRPNHVSFYFAQGQYGGSNTKGGCSAYRTPDMLSKAAAGLAELHPGFVRLVEKESKNWEHKTSGAFGGTRTDVTIAWKKAYESSTKTNGGD